jgi:hypothetical protein
VASAAVCQSAYLRDPKQLSSGVYLSSPHSLTLDLAKNGIARQF